MQTENQIKLKPQLQRRIFWDVDFDKLDYKKRANFIIERVFERGDVEDIRQCRRYYNKRKVSSALLNAKFLRLKTLYFAANIINKEVEDFRCYKYSLNVRNNICKKCPIFVETKENTIYQILDL